MKVTDKMHENLMKTLEEFVMVSDVLNNYENGIFHPNPEYNAGMTHVNFCGKPKSRENFSQEESSRWSFWAFRQLKNDKDTDWDSILQTTKALLSGRSSKPDYWE